MDIVQKRQMKPSRRPWAWLFPVLAASGLLAGCSPDGDSAGNYDGSWQGTTSHGGTVAFAVQGRAVTSLRITDDRADIWITQPAVITGDFFSVANSEGATAPGSPAVAAQGTFGSETHATGSYSISKGTKAWTGTFDASRL